MINNSISLAQYKLQLHKQKGTNSDLSILEVAKLMDVIHFGVQIQAAGSEGIFFQVSRN
jgi:hypothetical protein